MKHLSAEEIVEHYFADPGDRLFRVAQKHVDECVECAGESARLADDLNAMRGADFEELTPDYGEGVWRRVSGVLPPRVKPAPARRFKWGMGWRWALSYASASAVLVLGAFQVGRIWEHRQHPPIAAVTPTPPIERKVVVVVLGDHLDRSERLLVELKHADGEDAEVVKPLRDEARSLLAANHVFREDAERGDDTALKEALDHLDHLLSDVANEPGGLNAESIARLQKQMQKDGLLFEVRVLRSRTPHQYLTARLTAKGGAA